MGKMYEMLKTMKLLGGTGGSGPIDYDNLENLPTMNGNTIKGEMESSDLGLASESDMQSAENNISLIRGKVKAHSEGGTDYDVINGIRVYVSATAPTGDIPTGSLWIGG